jgi:hypothetical protein
LANVKITDLLAVTPPLVGTELLEVVQGSFSRKATASDIAALAATVVRTVATGGTGATTLTGVVKGNGTSAFTAGTVSLTTEVSGALPVANGGTGATTLTGYVKGSGTSAMTAAATVPFLDVAGRAFAQPSSAADQTGNVSAATAITFNTDLTGTGISVAASTQITFAAAGTYMLAPSIQFKNTDTNDHDATVWFRKNGANIANSATILSIPKAADGGAAVFSLTFFDTVTAGQYIEIMWLPENIAVTVDAIVAGAIAPAIPSILCPAVRIA